MWNALPGDRIRNDERQEYEKFMQITPCQACKGTASEAGALAVTVGDKNIYEVTNLSIEA